MEKKSRCCAGLCVQAVSVCEVRLLSLVAVVVVVVVVVVFVMQPTVQYRQNPQSQSRRTVLSRTAVAENDYSYYEYRTGSVGV